MYERSSAVDVWNGLLIHGVGNNSITIAYVEVQTLWTKTTVVKLSVEPTITKVQTPPTATTNTITSTMIKMAVTSNSPFEEGQVDQELSRSTEDQTPSNNILNRKNDHENPFGITTMLKLMNSDALHVSVGIDVDTLLNVIITRSSISWMQIVQIEPQNVLSKDECKDIQPNVAAFTSYINYMRSKKMAGVISLKSAGKVLYILPPCKSVELFVQSYQVQNPSLTLPVGTLCYGVVDDPFLWMPFT